MDFGDRNFKMAGLKTKAEALEELGLAGAAGDNDIRNAFRLRLKQAHPDLNGGTDARLRRLILARDLLISSRRNTPEETDSVEIFHTGNALGDGTVPLHISLGQAIHGGVAVTDVPALEFSRADEPLTSLTQTKTLQITLPAGLRDGEKVRLKCRGAVRDEMFFRISIDTHADCRVWGDDIWMTAQIAASLLHTGGQTSIDTPRGPRNIRVDRDVPSGASLCLHGHGLPATETATAGHLYVRLEAAPNTVRPSTRVLDAFRQRWAS